VPPLHRLPLGRSADLSPSFSRRCDAPRGSDSVSYFRCVFGRFTFVHLLSSYLPASYGRFLQQSLTTMAFWATAALPGLKPASARRLRGAYPHLLYSTGNPIHRLPVHVAPSRIFADARRRETELMRTTTSILALCGRDLLCRGSAPRSTPAMFQPSCRPMRQRPNVRLHGGNS
jgi:hypothetical protein